MRHRCGRAAVLAVASLVWGVFVPLPGQAQGLTLAELMRMALERNPGIAAAQQGVQGNAEALVRVGQAPRVELFKITTRLAAVRQGLIRVQNALELAHAGLNTLLGPEDLLLLRSMRPRRMDYARLQHWRALQRGTTENHARQTNPVSSKKGRLRRGNEHV